MYKTEIINFFKKTNWDIINSFEIPGREGKWYSYKNLPLSKITENFLEKATSDGLYLHQVKAIKSFVEGKNVCLTTGTSSGKSLVFYTAAIEIMSKKPDAKVLAIYPLKALGKEQMERWKKNIELAGLNAKVVRIDGDVSISKREETIRKSNVVIATPDIIHAWLLNNLNKKTIKNFLKKVCLIVVDEIHNYTGVFGSNSAYLFRRIRHAFALIRNSPKYVTASATIAKPEEHLEKLIGLNFEIIDEQYDTSPRHRLTMTFVTPPRSDILSAVSEFLDFIATNTEHRFIAFVDSRKQAELTASIVSRFRKKDDRLSQLSKIEALDVLPYRAGYEESDRDTIQKRLSKGSLKGIVSTSALELGIDIPFLSLGILVGVPRSSTSLWQRIGRVGRHCEGHIVIINNRDLHTQAIFQNPRQILNMPYYESSLYLENRRIQYIHTLCLARIGGEHDQLCSVLDPKDETVDFSSPITWPPGFIDLCRKERMGIVDPELRDIKTLANDDPNRVFPLRDVDVQFKIIDKITGSRLGRISYEQLLREAYPGAVYYYATQPYRVCKVNNRYSRTVEVRKEKKHYTTSPIVRPTLVFPNLNGSGVKGTKYGKLILIESELQIRKIITGFKKRRGSQEVTFNYPLNDKFKELPGIYFDKDKFVRIYFSSGVVFSHPFFNSLNSSILEKIANLIFESFLMVIPYERTDLDYTVDKFRANNNSVGILKDEKFICIYDQTYGSLRLSGRLMEREILEKTLKNACKIASEQAERQVILQLLNNLNQHPEVIHIAENSESHIYSNKLIQLIKPNSKGINIKRQDEFLVEEIVFVELGDTKQLCYAGKYLSEEKTSKYSLGRSVVPVENIKPIPGVSELGLYDVEKGKFVS